MLKNCSQREREVFAFGLEPPTYGTLARTEIRIFISGEVSLSSHLHMGRPSHTLTEGSESLPALSAISVPDLYLNPVIRYMKKRNIIKRDKN